VFRMYASGDKKGKIVIATRGDLVRYLSPFFYGEKTEKFYMLCLDAKSTVIKLVKLSSGIPQEVRVDVRDVVDNALKYKAVSVVVAHNHPSGDVSPSVQDVELTRAIAAALQLIKIKLADHYIFSDFGYCSFVEDGVGGQRRVFAIRNRNDPCGAQAAGVVPNIGDLWLSIMYGRLDGARHKAWSGNPRPQANPRPLDVCRTAVFYRKNTVFLPPFYTST